MSRKFSPEEIEEFRRRGRHGGKKTRFLYGKEHFKKIGKKGGKKTWE